MASVHVIGSVNLDLVATASRLPGPGETVGGASFARHPGGKGANQALAAARMGADTTLSAAVGRDADQALALLREADHLDLDLHLTDTPTGVALIAVDASGENQIVVAPGSNELLFAEHLPEIVADATLVQLEVPVATVAAALEAATGLRCLNAAPATPDAASLLAWCDVVVVNETERATLADALAEFDGLVITTLGADGAVAHRRGDEVAAARPPEVRPVDAVGAGDAFCGALVTMLAEGAELPRALALATTAGALATETRGAQASLPDRRAVEARCPSPS
jgi:ribokinase